VRRVEVDRLLAIEDSRMRFPWLPALGLALVAAHASAQLAPEVPGTITLPEPTPAWFLVKSDGGIYVFDGDSGEMQGLISNDTGIYTPAIITVPARKEAYMVESFYSRAVRGERTDVVSVIDMTTLTTTAEIDVPDRTAALEFRGHAAMMGDDRHLAVFNQTPSQSVSIVDVVERRFIGEIATPGCAVMMPVAERDFIMICADGRLQLIRLDASGNEASRARSEVFFSVDEDAVFDRVVKSNAGWVLVSRNGLVFEASVDGDRVRIAKPWPIEPAAERSKDPEKTWRPGGSQPFAINRPLGLLYVLVHQGPMDTHSEPGTELWVLSLEHRRRVARLELKAPANNVLASQQEHPLLYLAEEAAKLRIHDGLSLKRLRTIHEPGPRVRSLQNLSQND
jgi:methylamine dehydrogenase heavy chain